MTEIKTKVFTSIFTGSEYTEWKEETSIFGEKRVFEFTESWLSRAYCKAKIVFYVLDKNFFEVQIAQKEITDITDFEVFRAELNLIKPVLKKILNYEN